MLSPARLRSPLFALSALWLGLAAGCSSDSRPEREGPITLPDYPAAMTGSENFIDGKVAVEITLGMPTDLRPGKGGGGKGDGGSGGGRRRGGHRGGGSYGGEMGGGGPAGGDAGDGAPAPRIMGSTLPPAQLKLHLKNTTPGETVSCEVVDFSSSLGNFAVFPATYQLEAGQSAISETMTSRLGVEGSAIPVTVGLRVKGGEVERKVVTLRLIVASEKPAEPSPPAK